MERPASSLLSAVVIAENEEPIIGRCLEALAFCDEIVLVDGGSTDRTIELAREKGARIIEHSSLERGIHFNKNLGAEAATGDWILSIDADEIVSPELATEIRAALATGTSTCYRLSRRTWFLGRWIRHSGWWPGQVIRLWKRGATRWPLEVHGVPAASGPVGALHAPLDHHSYADLADWGRKVMHFSGCEAVERLARGAAPGRVELILGLTLRPLAVFARKLIWLSGWRDGHHGLVVAGSAAFATWLRYARLWECGLTGKPPALGGRKGRKQNAE